MRGASYPSRASSLVAGDERARSLSRMRWRRQGLSWSANTVHWDVPWAVSRVTFTRDGSVSTQSGSARGERRCCCGPSAR